MPVKHEPSEPYEPSGPGWGDCPACGKERRLVDGELVAHRRFTRGVWPWDVSAEPCSGSGLFPAVELADEPALD
jgi:hypothetical protein